MLKRVLLLPFLLGGIACGSDTPRPQVVANNRVTSQLVLVVDGGGPVANAVNTRLRQAPPRAPVAVDGEWGLGPSGPSLERLDQ